MEEMSSMADANGAVLTRYPEGLASALEKIKQDPDLKRIPVVILTTSEAERDILQTYYMHANCYITKPVDLDQFITVVKSIETFWLNVVKLPTDQ